MSKQEEAGLILKLYELRRETVMREARNWYFRDFHPTSAADFDAAMFGEHSAHLRMVTTYWDMAAALVNHGAIDVDLFAETSGEAFGVFSKLELLVPELRNSYGPHFLKNLGKLVDETKGGREMTASIRERMARMRERISSMPRA